MYFSGCPIFSSVARTFWNSGRRGDACRQPSEDAVAELADRGDAVVLERRTQ
jgi:hypothetical protein